MQQNIKKSKRSLSAGFTIIELIVVVAIIGTLSAIVVANVSGYIKKAKETAVQADLRQVSVMSSLYTIDNGDYGGFCNSTPAINAAAAIKRANPSYVYTCYDSEGSYTVFNPKSWEAYAALSGGCAANEYAITVSGLSTSSGCYCISGSGGVVGGSSDSGGAIINSCGTDCGC